MNYTYILKCSDGTFYTGWTNHLERRLAAHNAGTGAKYTRSHRPVELFYFETFPSREAAMRREWQIKQLRHSEKAALKERGQPYKPSP